MIKLGIPLALLAIALAMREPKPQQQAPPKYVRISSGALKAWSILFREFHTEFFGCLYGHQERDELQIRFLILAEIKPSQATPTAIMPPIQCVNMSGEDSLVGIAHSHPSGRCYESFLDHDAFESSRLIASVVVCGQKKIWIGLRGSPMANICLFDPEVDDVPTLDCTPIRSDSGSTGASKS